MAAIREIKREPVVTDRKDMGNGYIVFTVQGGERHTVTLKPNGQAMCLDSHDARCMAHKCSKPHTCKHVEAAMKIEDMIQGKREQDRQQQIDDAEYAQWKHEMGLDQPMTREEYYAEFNPDGIL